MKMQPIDPPKGRWQDWLNVTLGAWLLIAPILGVSQVDDVAAWSSYLAGALVMVLAVAAIVRVRAWKEWTTLLVGLWLIAAPFSLHFTDELQAVSNHMIVGTLVSVASAWAIRRLKSCTCVSSDAARRKEWQTVQ